MKAEADVAGVAEIFQKCAALYFAAESRTGATLAAEGVKRARKLGDQALLRKMLTAQGNLAADLHDLPQAFSSFAEAVDLCRQLDSPQDSFYVWVNTSGALAYAELPELAIAAAEVARDSAAQIDDATLRPAATSAALSNLAYGALLAGRHSIGLHAIEEAKRLFPEGRRLSWNALDVDFLVLVLSTRARLLLKVNFLDEAKVVAAELATLSSNASLGRRTRYALESALALCDAYFGRFDSGVARLKALLTGARSIAPVMVVDCLRDLQEAHVVGKRHDVASAYQLQLAEHVGHLRTEAAKLRDDQYSSLASGLQRKSKVRERLAPRREVMIPDNVRPSARLHRSALADLCVAAELYDDISGMHPQRVGALAYALAREIGLSEVDATQIAQAAELHDIGKVSIPASILTKRMALDQSELEIVQSHSLSGAGLLALADMENAQTAVDVARHHHERWSGDGYPDRLRGNQIPLAARITSLAEAFDAMTHDRPYRSRHSISRALQTIAEGAGLQFDPALSETFCRLVRDLCAHHSDLDAHLEQASSHSVFVRAQRTLLRGMKRS